MFVISAISNNHKRLYLQTLAHCVIGSVAKNLYISITYKKHRFFTTPHNDAYETALANS